MGEEQRKEIAEAAYRRAMSEHTAEKRAGEMIDILESF